MKKLSDGEKGMIIRTIIWSVGILATALFMIWANDPYI